MYHACLAHTISSKWGSPHEFTEEDLSQQIKLQQHTSNGVTAHPPRKSAGEQLQLPELMWKRKMSLVLRLEIKSGGKSDAGAGHRD